MPRPSDWPDWPAHDPRWDTYRLPTTAEQVHKDAVRRCESAASQLARVKQDMRPAFDSLGFAAEEFIRIGREIKQHGHFIRVESALHRAKEKSE